VKTILRPITDYLPGLYNAGVMKNNYMIETNISKIIFGKLCDLCGVMVNFTFFAFAAARWLSFLIFLYLISFTIIPLHSQDGEFDFGEEEEKKETAFSIPLRGKIRLEADYQYGKPRFIHLGPALNLIFDHNTDYGLFYGEATGRANLAYDLERDDRYVTDNYRFEGVLRELYWKKPFGAVTLSAGNIIIVWTNADILPVTDLISPLDQSESYFAKPEASRLGQNSLKLDYFVGDHEFNLVYIPYPFYDRYTDGNHPYSTTPGFYLKKNYEYKNHQMEGGLRWSFQYKKATWSVMGAYLHNRQPIIKTEIDSLTFATRLNSEHTFYPIAGTSFTFAWNPFLFKTEGAYLFNNPMQKMTSLVDPRCANPILAASLNCNPALLADGSIRTDVVTAMAGLDYQTANKGTFLAEASFKAPMEINSALAQNRIIYLYGIGWTDTFLNEDLSLNTFIFFLEKYRNILGRLSASYKFTDSLSVESQITMIFIEDGDTIYSQIKDFDRVDLNFIYYFDLARNR